MQTRGRVSPVLLADAVGAVLRLHDGTRYEVQLREQHKRRGRQRQSCHRVSAQHQSASTTNVTGSSSEDAQHRHTAPRGKV